MGRHTKPSLVTSVEARPPGVSFESRIIHDGPSLSWSVRASVLRDMALTIWLSRLAAPRPVGPAPITSTSTDLSRSGLARREANDGGSLQVRHLFFGLREFKGM